ncbi:MAG: membrane-associated protein [Spirosomataceae bacterium]|jgi:membrane-associated protein
MQSISEFFHLLMDSKEIIQTGGLIAIVLIVYVENGLFFGFFLPGDYLLFLSGVFCATKLLSVSISILMLCVFAAAVAGSLTGYGTGRFFGESILNRKDSLIFKKKYIKNTEKYFDKFGSQTLVIARFLPIIRTFAPIIAGLVRMNFPKYILYNILGAVLWTILLVGGGYYFGIKFPWIVDYVHYIVIFFLAITTFTVIKGYFKARDEMTE